MNIDSQPEESHTPMDLNDDLFLRSRIKTAFEYISKQYYSQKVAAEIYSVRPLNFM